MHAAIGCLVCVLCQQFSKWGVLALQDGPEGGYTVHFNSYEEGGKVGKPQSIKVDAVVGADGANSRVAKEIDAGEYDYAIAFQVGRPSSHTVY